MKNLIDYTFLSLLFSCLFLSILFSSNVNPKDIASLEAKVNPSSVSYCSAIGAAPWEEFITTVSYGTVDHLPISGFEDNGNGKNSYGDFTGQVSDLTKGHSFELNIISKLKNIPDETYYYSIWIDFDQDENFSDLELIATYSKDYGGQQFFNDYINIIASIPASAITGLTRMRIAMKRGSEATPCGDFEFGEVEDYGINVLDPPTPGPSPKTFVALSDEVNSTSAYFGNILNFTYNEKYEIEINNNLLDYEVTSLVTPDHQLVTSGIICNKYGNNAISIDMTSFVETIKGGWLRLKITDANKGITQYLNFKLLGS